MTNRFDSGAQLSPQGWIAWYRDVKWSENRVLRDGKHDIIFASQQEAKDAGHEALMSHLNGHMTGERNIAPLPTSKERKFAEASKRLFLKGGKSVIVEKRTEVERRRIPA
ncbi:MULTISPECIES: hypothetical protein [unclassified Rhizobium]|uniref:hypothetical protein n=1 Tax=unclassified Rhizobium TaxID=2613769 RepID=UPI00288A4199|nr:MULTISPECIES: hypothetical protein [unclassified Rhizobium]